MSHEIDERYTVHDETTRRARKAHRCDACDEPIRIGDAYNRSFIVFQGDVETVKRCLRCQKIHLHLRGLEPGETWPDERLACGEEYQEHWGEAPPDDIAALAFALPGETKL